MPVLPDLGPCGVSRFWPEEDPGQRPRDSLHLFPNLREAKEAGTGEELPGTPGGVW